MLDEKVITTAAADLNSAKETNTTDEQGVFYAGRAYYETEYGENGVFLNVDMDPGSYTPINPVYLNFDLTRRNIKGINFVALQQNLRMLETRIRLSGPQDKSQYDSDVAVIISKDGMSAEMMLFPPSKGGIRKTAEEILSKISGEWKVVSGLDEAVIRSAVESEKYYQPFFIAQGKPPEKGKDGYLTFMFSTEHNYSPVILPDGSADYKNLNIFEPVKEGDTLVVKVPPETGVDGYNVKGDTLSAKPGLDARLPAGKNTKVSEDGMSILAVKSGRVDVVNGRVEISDIYRIFGDVDLSVGNIKFEGDVIIGGDVLAGLSVEASGLIEVAGYVEGATLTAGKDIVLKKGMQGGTGKGILNAGGNIVAKFIESCNANAKGNIISDYIVHSTVLAGGSITAKGKWGKIIGGLIRAGKEVTANYLGSPSYDATVVEVGNDPEIRARCCELEMERAKLMAQIQKIESIARVTTADNNAERQEMRQKLIDTKEHLVMQYDELSSELEQCNLRLEEKCCGRVNVLKNAYPNVKITIDSSILTTKTMTEYATFKALEGEVKIQGCEVRA